MHYSSNQHILITFPLHQTADDQCVHFNANPCSFPPLPLQKDEQRKRCEQEEIKELRKMTAFKARPNPFK